MPTLAGYAYAQKADILYVNLFIGGSATIRMGKDTVHLKQETRYPWDGDVKITVEPQPPDSAGASSSQRKQGTGLFGTCVAGSKEFAIYIRIPGWAQNRPVPSDLYYYPNENEQKVTLRVNNRPFGLEMDKGFACIRRKWKKGDVIELNLPMPIRRVLSHQKVKDNAGRIAIQRGPVVYCFEGVDNPQGVANLVLPPDAELHTEYRAGMLGGIVTIKGQGKIQQHQAEGQTLLNGVEAVAIPYYAWAHRGKSEMAVWLVQTKN
jgi:DUF1680 family protein